MGPRSATRPPSLGHPSCGGLGKPLGGGEGFFLPTRPGFPCEQKLPNHECTIQTGEAFGVPVLRSVHAQDGRLSFWRFPSIVSSPTTGTYLPSAISSHPDL